MDSSLTIMIPDEEKLGPKMQALNPRQRVFVIAWFHLGDKVMAARAAGYSDKDQATLSAGACQVWASVKVQEAITEFARSSVIGGLLPKAMKVLEEELNNRGGKDRVKVAELVMNRTGLHPQSEHKVTVEHIDRIDAIKKVIAMALANGQNPRVLLGQCSDITDADFEILEREVRGEPKGITPATEELEDWEK